MTNKIQNSILRLFLLLLTLIVASGNITTTAYSNTDYFQNCPTDFPYCYEQPNLNKFDQCTMATSYYYGNCLINESGYSYSDSKIDTNKLDCSNYYTSTYYSCNPQYSTSPLPEFSTSNPKGNYYTDYCGYLGANNCTNIVVNPPKTTLDPVYGCKPSLSNSYCYSYDYQTYPETSSYTYYQQSNNQQFFDNSGAYYSSINPNFFSNSNSFVASDNSFYPSDYMSYGYYQ